MNDMNAVLIQFESPFIETHDTCVYAQCADSADVFDAVQISLNRLGGPRNLLLTVVGAIRGFSVGSSVANRVISLPIHISLLEAECTTVVAVRTT